MGRKLLIGLLTPLLAIFLFGLALSIGLKETLGTSGALKHAVATTSLYSTAVPSLLKQQGSISTVFGNVSTDSPLVQQSAEQALPPSEVKQQTNAAIDSIYAWLNGKIAQPSFSIGPSNAQVAGNFSSEIEKTLAGLPRCQSLASAASFNPLNANCLPPGISAAQVANLIQNSAGSLDRLNLTAASLTSAGSGQSVFSGPLKTAPSKFQLLRKAPALLGVVTLVTAALLVYLRPTWQKGIRQVSFSVLSVGVIILLLAWVLKAMIPTAAATINIGSIGTIQQAVQNIAQVLGRQLAHNYYLLGAIYLIAGLVLTSLPIAFKPAAAGTEAAAGKSRL